MKKLSAILLTVPVILLSSCAGDGNGDSSGGSTPAAASTGMKERSMDEWVGENSRDNGFKTDAAGNFVPRSNKRSSFELNRDSAYFKGDYAKKDFKTNDYSKKSWWGDTKYEAKNYQGDTDGSRFRSASRFQGAGARESGSAADLPGAYKTGSYATRAARETAGTRIDRPSDAETDVRRRVYTAPSVIDWRAQRGMSVSEAKGLLGR